ncbi:MULTISPECIES: FAD-dependent oxidoreductase [Streptomyces]|uniref:FAD-dependent oxidoreductase n=1 Tax=Streptomyces silvae TaxID=2803812 RepID=A0ABU8ACM0_9ACTN|nr:MULTISPECIES: FAD-dependent oxidoreductase [unclassified Streptomyces]MDX3323447.1 FAD-dependent oxidoreductase [Streptomyces sp. ME02-6979-3A]RPK35105.1 Gamma-glutamylputrescine oxidoreductase [Streptomyces sp. ADI93-02]
MTTRDALPGMAESYWMATAPGTAWPELETDATADVAVIGAGMAGLSTAWELAAAGRKVIVLEADRVAAGVTGHTTAKLTAAHSLVYERLRRTRGSEGARQYASTQQAAVERVASVAAELGIDCDFERASALTFTTAPDERAAFEAEADAAAEAGLDADFVTETDLPFPVAAAVRVRDQAQFHPRKYLLALANDLTARGGVIHERTRVTGLSEGSPCTVTTERGTTITAQDVVIATHYPVFDRALHFARLSPRRELVVAAPLPRSEAPDHMYITDDMGKRSVRTAPLDEGRRLLIVTGESFTPGTGDTSARFRRLDAWMHDHFPVGTTIYRWAAQDNDVSDGVPLVGPYHPGARHVYVATGFGGWGMSGGAMAGQLLASALTGAEFGGAGLYDPRRLWSTLREGPALLKQQAEVAQHFVGDRLKTTHVDSVAEIAPGSGGVVRVEGRRCAVYRDADGTAHAVSARCTHLGCLVAFNEAETAWECPCHGSRFGIDGEVLHGPALRPLPPRKI